MKRITRRFIRTGPPAIAAVVLFLVTAALPVTGQGPGSAAEDPVMTKIRGLEAQVAAMAAEIAKLRSEVNSKPKAEAAEAGERGQASAAVEKPPGSAKAGRDTAETVGVNLGDGLMLIPYGTVYFNAFGNTGGTNNIDVPLWATSSDEKNLGASLRQTRFGVRVEGARLGGANVSGVIEADFYGGLPAVPVGENFGVVRLRVAKMKADWEKTSLTIGQDWVVFAPQNPVSIAAAAIPQFAASGNLWSRLPQVRIEQKLADGNILLQGAVLAPTSGDFPTGPDTAFLLQPGAASRSSVPSFQGRLAFTGNDWFSSGKPGTLAVSTHFGRAKFEQQALNSYGVAADWKLPLTDRIAATGELFYGQALGGFQGGIFQGFNPDFESAQLPEGTSGSARAIRSRGGWLQLSFTPNVLKDRLSFHGSVGADDPYDSDLVSVSPRNWRSRNLSYAFNVIFKPIPRLSIGGELRRFETTYLITGKRTAEHINFGAAYSF